VSPPGSARTFDLTRVLYLSYDGMLDPLGQAQVIPYLVGLSRAGYSFDLVSFEKPGRSAEHAVEMREALAGHGIDWHPLPYTKRPPVLSTVYDVERMRSLAFRLQRKRPFDLVHCRSYLSSLVGLSLKRRFGTGFLFDMRGFWADERVDGDLWNLRNPVYRAVYAYFKRREADFLLEASGVVTLTEAGRREMERWEVMKKVACPVSVIPCSVDFDQFSLITPEARAASRSDLGIPASAFTLVYLGSLGTWYLLEEMLELFANLMRLRPDAHFLFVSPDASPRAQEVAARFGIPENRIIIRSVRRSEVPDLLATADYGISFIKPSYSKIGSSPTKLGEYLAMGLPVVTNGDVGDVAEIVRAMDAGVVVDALDPDSLRRAASEVLGRPRPDGSRIRESARPYFDLGTAVEAYGSLYERILGSPANPAGP